MMYRNHHECDDTTVLWTYLPVNKQSSTTDSEFRGIASLTKGGFQEAPHT